MKTVNCNLKRGLQGSRHDKGWIYKRYTGGTEEVQRRYIGGT